MRVSLPPCVHDRFEFVLSESHIEGSHSFESTDRAAITTGEHRNLPLLTKLTINAVLIDWDAENTARGFAVEVFALTEGLKGGGFSCEPCDDTRLNRRKVRDNKPVPR